jgi:hypothetical protein
MLIQNKEEYNLLLRDTLYNNAKKLRRNYETGVCTKQVENNVLINHFLSVMDSPRLDLTDEAKEVYMAYLRNEYKLSLNVKDLFFLLS